VITGNDQMNLHGQETHRISNTSLPFCLESGNVDVSEWAPLAVKDAASKISAQRRSVEERLTVYERSHVRMPVQSHERWAQKMVN
jgi:hypothetical protein